MGVVKRQSVKYTLVSILGTFIGAASVLFIYPLDDELYGYASWIFSTAAILVPLGSLGIPSIIVKYYTQYSDRPKQEFFGLVLGLYLVAFSVFAGTYYLLRPLLLSLLESIDFNPDQLVANDIWLLIICFFFGIVRILFSFSSIKKRIAIPQLLENVGYKIYLPVAFLVVWYNQFDDLVIVYAIMFFFIVLITALTIYDLSIGSFKLAMPRLFRSEENKRAMLEFSLFSSLNGIGNLITTRLDLVMIPLILTMADNGIYAKILVIVNILNLPLQSVINIAKPIVSEHWHTNNTIAIQKLYKQSGNNLFFIAMLFFLMIYFSLPHLVEISGKPESFLGYATIFLLLGSGKLVDALCSINSSIIIYSEKFRVHLYFILIMAVLNLVLNIYFIQHYGIIGAAIATVIALLLFNVLKSGYIYAKFKMHSFSLSNLKTLVLGIVLFIGLSSIDFGLNPYLSIIILGVLLTLTFILAGLLLNISREVNETIQDILHKVKSAISHR